MDINERPVRLELQIWQEENDQGGWRCRVVAPDALYTVRLNDYTALSAYVTQQIELLLAQHTTEQLQQERRLEFVILPV